MKLSNKYIIGCCVILVLILIAILIYILTRKNGGTQDYTYTQETLSRPKTRVCVAPYSSSSDKRDYVKNLCDLNPDCKGYYGDTNDNYFVATYKDPSECTEDKGGTSFTKYFKKPEYNDIGNISSKYGCQLKTSNTCDNKVCADGKYVEKLCNLDPNCVGYYTNTDKTIFVATDYDNTVSNDIFCDDEFKDLNLFNRKSPPPSSRPLPQPTWYYPFSHDIKNYASGTGVSDAVMGVSGNLSGGTESFSDGGLVLTGSANHNADGASYVVLPKTSSGETKSFCCWFKSNSNPTYSRIIDIGETFRIYISDNGKLLFNDRIFINNENINNNKWTFIAINVDKNNMSSWITQSDSKNINFKKQNIQAVSLNNLQGFLGHSFGHLDPEFAGTLKQVRFFADINLTLNEIRRFYQEGFQVKY
jgi:hypothetical protein